ncbi:MAG: NAD(P)-dependent oxidoreductase [Thaumarchaeota archaeon]|nr:NAD(P)-dependent oxidoreductase [Nitrososphaerota archaeon]
MSLTILITGGTGFVGAHLARRLVNEGERVILFDASPNPKRIQDVQSKLKIIRGDLTVLSEVLDAVRSNGVEGIFHFGATISAAADARPVASFQVNYAGTLNVLEAARLFDVKKVVYSSSMAIYKPSSGKVNEDYEKWPWSSYGVSKVFSELWGQFCNKKYGIDFRAIRFPTVIGPGREWSTFAFASFIVQKAALGESFDVPVREDFRTPITYIKDAIGAAIALYKAEVVKQRAYNLASMAPGAKEIVSEVRKHIPDAPLRFVLNEELARAAEERNPPQLDGTRMESDLGYKPQYSLERVVPDFIQEIRNNKAMYA